MRTLALRLRWSVPQDDHRVTRRPGSRPAGLAALEAKMDDSEDVFLDVIDGLLHVRAEAISLDRLPLHAPFPQWLDDLLREGGSAWRVNGGETGLERRVEEAVSAAMAEATRSAPASAGGHLRLGWHEAYGRSPDPTKAYSEAIKAVEAAAIPVVCPTNPKATISTVRGDLDKTQGAWELAIIDWAGASDAGPVVEMLRLLERGQTDRHGGVRPTQHVTQDAAEMAVHLATTLVQWFSAGHVRRR